MDDMFFYDEEIRFESRNDNSDPARAGYIVEEMNDIDEHLTKGDLLKASLMFMASFGYNPEFTKDEEAVYAVQETCSMLRSISLDNESPEVYSVLELGQSLMDDMDPKISSRHFFESLEICASLQENDRALTTEVLKKGNSFEMVKRLTKLEGDEYRRYRKKMIELVPKRKKAGFKEKKTYIR